MSHAAVLCTGPIGGAVSLGKGRVLVSVQGDGVTCYDVDTRKPSLAWALGAVDQQEFSSAAVFDHATNLCFAPVRQRGAAKAGGSVLAWSADATSGTITQLAHPIHLPALHSLFPVTHTPEGEEEEQAAAEAEEKQESEVAQVDGSGQAVPGAVAVLAAGGVALCSGSEVVDEAEEAGERHVVAASYSKGVLVVVHREARGGGGAAATVYRLQGGKLQREEPVELVPPSEGCLPLAATATPERTAVLWSDGSVAVYIVPGDKRPLWPGPDCSGPRRRPANQRRLAGFRLPAPGKQGRGGGKKRGGGGGPEGQAAGGVGMATLGEKQFALAGWATNEEGAVVLRLVVMETAAACVQLAADFTAADVGLAALDPTKAVQVDSLGPDTNQLVVSVGTAVLIATLPDLKPPTLANLLGALAIDRAQAVLQRQRNAGSSGGGSSVPGLIPAPGLVGVAAAGSGAASDGPLLGSTLSVNPAALAAARVLHADELAELTQPFGGAARPIEVFFEHEPPEDPAEWLVPAKVTWKVAGEGGEEADKAIAAEERRVWGALQQPAGVASEAAMQQELAPLLALARDSGLQLAPRLVCRLLMLAAEHQHWGAAAAILEVQRPTLLSEVPGLAAAAADAGQFGLLERLLGGGPDASAPELLALLRVLLSPASSEAAQQARQARLEALQAAADAAERAAEQAVQRGAAAAPDLQQQQQGGAAAQQQQQQQQQGGRASSRRQRRKAQRGADGGEAEAAPEAAEGDTAAAPGSRFDAFAGSASAPPGVAGQQAEEQQEQVPQVGPLLAPGGRERAIAACCKAAVQGFSPDHACLHPVLLLPVRPAVLVPALRGLTAQQAVQLLRYVVVLLGNHASLVGCATAGWQPPLALPPGVALPSMADCLEWVNATIDASLIKLSHEPEAAPLLRTLQELVDAELAAIRPLQRLEGIIKQLLADAKRAEAARWAAAPADYSVQWLDLRIGQQQDGQQEGLQQDSEDDEDEGEQ